jgi:hypothetical protein
MARQTKKPGTPHAATGLSQFRDAGLDQDFVVTYCIALGYSGDTKRLREHCNEAGIPKKWKLPT